MFFNAVVCSSDGTAVVALVALITGDLVNYVFGEAEVISRGGAFWLVTAGRIIVLRF